MVYFSLSNRLEFQYSERVDILTIFVLVLIVVLVPFLIFQSFVLPRTQRGKEQMVLQKQAAESKLQQLRDFGIEPLPAKQKMMHMFGMALASGAVVFLIQTLLFSWMWDSGLWLFFLPASLFFGLFISILSAAIANKAEEVGKSWTAFLWLSTLISPLITWLIIATVKPIGSVSIDASQTSRSLEAKLTELSSLLENGLITQQEFEKKKSELLDKI